MTKPFTPPAAGTPFRWKRRRLLIVPEASPEKRCHGCIADKDYPDFDEQRFWRQLCQVQGKNDCSKFDQDGEYVAGHIFIRASKRGIADYIAARLE